MGATWFYVPYVILPLPKNRQNRVLRGSRSDGSKNNDKKLQRLLEAIERATFAWITRSFSEKHVFLASVQAACRAKEVFLNIPYRWVCYPSTPITSIISS
jgi:hypothetical protein